MSGLLLEAHDIHIHFDGVIAADGIDLAVVENEVLAIVGPNGAGKTTFLNICTGYLRPQRGTVHFRGVDITRKPSRALPRLGIARSFQIPQLFLEHSVLDNVLLALSSRRGFWRPFYPMRQPEVREEALRLLDLLELGEVAGRPAIELPEGLRKLVDVALALALDPKLLLMDEPTSGVSSAEKTSVMDTLVAALRKKEVTAVFVEHDMDIVTRYADRVAVWNAGKIEALDVPERVLSDPEVRRAVVGVELDAQA